MSYYEFEQGEGGDCLPWNICMGYTVSWPPEWASPCKHARNVRRLVGKPGYADWELDAVVVAYNEGGCAATAVCLDCILEAAAAIEAGTAIPGP